MGDSGVIPRASLFEPRQLAGRGQKRRAMSGGRVYQVAMLVVQSRALENGAQVGVRACVQDAPLIVQKDERLALRRYGNGVNLNVPSGELAHGIADGFEAGARVEGACQLRGVRLVHILPTPGDGGDDAPREVRQVAAQRTAARVHDQNGVSGHASPRRRGSQGSGAALRERSATYRPPSCGSGAAPSPRSRRLCAE